MSTYTIEGSQVVGELTKKKDLHVIAYLSNGSSVAHVREREGMRLSKRGITVRVAQLPELLALVEALQQQATINAEATPEQSREDSEPDANATDAVAA